MPVPDSMIERLGPENAARRLVQEKRIERQKEAVAQGDFSLRRHLSVDRAAKYILSLLALTGEGENNLLNLEIVENVIVLPHLPPAFEGFRLLHLTDLHCDIHPRLMDAIKQQIQGITHDAVVLTGDYHNQILESFEASMEAMRRFIPHLHPVRFAILGNHDHLENAFSLEQSGLRVLLNEKEPLIRDSQRIWICGTDDNHRFKSHDLRKAREGIPSGEMTILLSHSPETHREAAALGYDLQLSGHTHGGQICLPGGIPILHNAPGCRRELIAGPWREGSMLGYTSRGAGAAGVAARFFCPPEITIHTLRSRAC
jgi:hypothetical protein